jgi:adenylate cyclase
VRLLEELRERTEEVEKLNKQLEQRVADQVGEIERLGRLRRFLPPQVADLIVASGTEKQLENHRREITTLFCDLRGFTGFSESSRPRRGDGVRERAVMSADAPKLPLPVQ